MEAMDLFDFQQVYSKLEDILKCPICLEYLEPPVSQCRSGHGVCAQCRKKLVECPLCRGTFTECKATVLSQVVEVLPRTCKYRTEGCPVLSFLREKHMNYCEFRPTKCFICGTVTPVKLLYNHFENKHKKLHLYDKTGVIKDFKLTETITRLSLFTYFGHLFWRKFSVDVERQIVSLGFALIPTGSPMKKYYANIKLKKGRMEYSSYSVIHMRKDMNIEATIPNIIIPLQEMSHFLNKLDETLSFECLSIEEADFD